MEKKVLGRGLDALIPKKFEEAKRDLIYLPVEKIHPSPYQPREEIASQELEELASSIKEKGIIQPILVRKVEGRYEIVAGHRRFSAAKLLRLKELPAVVKEISDQDALVYTLVENIQRKDLNPLEEAQGFKKLHKDFGLTYEEIARLVGKDKTSVANTLRLLKLPPQIQAAVKKGVISRSQARTILGIDNEEKQKRLFYKILKEGLSVRDIEERVRTFKGKRKKKPNLFIQDLEEKLKKDLGTKVKIFHRKNNTGRIVIEYYNLQDLERIIKKFR